MTKATKAKRKAASEFNFDELMTRLHWYLRMEAEVFLLLNNLRVHRTDLGYGIQERLEKCLEKVSPGSLASLDALCGQHIDLTETKKRFPVVANLARKRAA